MIPETRSLLLATHNPAKLQRYQGLLAPFAWLRLLAPADLGLRLNVVETGTSAAENARLKAEAYAGAASLPALGIDEALYIPALPPEAQPGVLVRRNGGKTLDDEALLEMFLSLARSLPPEQRGVSWVFALCLTLPDNGPHFTAQAGCSGWLSDQPCRPYAPGYPLSAILLDGATHKRVRRLSTAETKRREAPLADALAELIHQWVG